MENNNSSMLSQSVISISDRFKTVAFLVLIPLFCAATGCSEDYNSRMAGDYIGNQTGEMIRLKEDGTFVAGKKNGTWSFNGGLRIDYRLSSGEECSDQFAAIFGGGDVRVNSIYIEGEGSLTQDFTWTREGFKNPYENATQTKHKLNDSADAETAKTIEPKPNDVVSKEVAKALKEEINDTGTITLEQTKILSDYHLELQTDWALAPLKLDSITSITEQQAVLLGRVKNLELNGITSLTIKQCESLGNVEGRLTMNGLTELTDEGCRLLCNAKVINLEGLTSLSDQQITHLSKQGPGLNLSGLSEISESQLSILLRERIQKLELNGLTTLTDAQAKLLSRPYWLSLNGLTIITPQQAEQLVKSAFGNGVKQDITLNGLSQIDRTVALQLVQAELVTLKGLTSIDDETLKVLISDRQGYHTFYINSVELTGTQIEILENKPEHTTIWHQALLQKYSR
jgi:hypothetical protein